MHASSTRVLASQGRGAYHFHRILLVVGLRLANCVRLKAVWYILKEHIVSLLQSALDKLLQSDEAPASLRPKVQVERTRNSDHGDFASNLALVLAKSLGHPPSDVAQRLTALLPASSSISKIEIAEPGFINFFLAAGAGLEVVSRVLEAGKDYGRKAPSGRRVQVEFVSANPTGPLHVGHGRGAACGASIASLLEAAGFAVEREYYVNDAGRQMHILVLSIWLRCLEHCGERIRFPMGGYAGDYIADYGRQAAAARERMLHRPASAVFENLPQDGPGEVGEKHLDALIGRQRQLLEEADYHWLADLAAEGILKDIQEDLAAFGINYQRWYSERSLRESGQLEQALERLQSAGCTEERDGALWFCATRFGDDKDRVLRRKNGEPTYFAADVAYHLDKFERGYERIINIWGADHHGYVPRLHAALRSLGLDPKRMTVQLVQLVSLYREGKPVSMSTRGGIFVTLRQLREEVGTDAARFFYIMRRAEQPADFDLDLAKSKSAENPVYYIQYAHARVCSVLRQLEEKGMSFDRQAGLTSLAQLTEPEEGALAVRLAEYPETVQKAAQELAPYLLANFLRELAGEFHACYNTHRVLHENEALRNARLCLCLAVRQVIANGLGLLGLSAPERM